MFLLFLRLCTDNVEVIDDFWMFIRNIVPTGSWEIKLGWGKENTDRQGIFELSKKNYSSG